MFNFNAKTHLKYRLDKLESAVGFQVLSQSKEVSDFLKRQNFMAKNGITIAIDGNHGGPEIKESANVIYLRGSNSSRDWNVDITRFASNKPYRDGKYKMYQDALSEFVDFIKRINPVYVVPQVVAYATYSNSYPVYPCGRNTCPFATSNGFRTFTVSTPEVFSL